MNKVLNLGVQDPRRQSENIKEFEKEEEMDQIMKEGI